MTRPARAVLENGGSASDLLATLSSLTVEAVVRSAQWAPAAPERWLVYGGGVRNLELMESPARATGTGSGRDH